MEKVAGGNEKKEGVILRLSKYERRPLPPYVSSTSTDTRKGC